MTKGRRESHLSQEQDAASPVIPETQYKFGALGADRLSWTKLYKAPLSPLVNQVSSWGAAFGLSSPVVARLLLNTFSKDSPHS